MNHGRKLATEGVKEIIKEFNIKECVAAILLGFEHKIIKITKEEAIGVTHKCSHRDAMGKLGVTEVRDCKAIRMDFVNAAINEINPQMEAKLETSIPDGAPVCHMRISKKR